jgi:hypothetical protein
MGGASADLNHFPSPANVLELREPLALSAEQIRAVQESFHRMRAAAKPLGVQIVAAEGRLGEAFVASRVTTSLGLTASSNRPKPDRTPPHVAPSRQF